MTGATAGAVAAGALTGCSGEPSDTGGRDRARGAQGAYEQGNAPGGWSEAADTRLRKRLAASGGALRDRYDAVIAAHPALAGRLTELRASAAAHVTALGGAAPGGAGASGAVHDPAHTTAPSPATSTAPAPGLTPDPDPARALADLVAAERRSSAAYTAALDGAGPELARLLASVAAAGAAHAYLLSRPVAADPGPGR
ncbi:hypothetical protein ABZ714_27980 [Streptomyces sp. NPDC006798]|uniref:hypothetical protein n=1 Tax=Streptomyces sp. NPDC006798 TaxID=3155462 RepID=UPI0033E624DF